MAGKCILCNNLSGKTFKIDDKEYNCGYCSKGKYRNNGIESYFSMDKIIKSVKAVSEIEENCDSWDDRLKPKRLVEEKQESRMSES